MSYHGTAHCICRTFSDSETVFRAAHNTAAQMEPLGSIINHTRHDDLFCFSRTHAKLCKFLSPSTVKSSLKHDYLRSTANLPPRKSTGVHEAVMKWQQPISFCLDPVIWRDFQQPEHLTALRALTSMQLPPRTVSFIMKGVKQSPHTQHTQTHVRTHSEVRCSQGDK